MVLIKIIALLALFAVTQANIYKKIDFISFNQFLKCVQQQMYRGNKAADIPSFNPYYLPNNYEFPSSLGPYLHTNLTIINIKWSYLSNFTYTLYEIPNKSYDTSVFKYTINWKRETAIGTWVRDRDFYGLKSHDTGLVQIDLYNRTWSGYISLTRSKIVNFEVNSHLGSAKVKFSNANKKQEKLIEPFSKKLWETLFNCTPLYATYLGKYYGDKFTSEWLQQPKRIDTVLKYCKAY